MNRFKASPAERETAGGRKFKFNTDFYGNGRNNLHCYLVKLSNNRYSPLNK